MRAQVNPTAKAGGGKGGDAGLTPAQQAPTRGGGYVGKLYMCTALHPIYPSGSLSAVSTPIFASKYSFFSIYFFEIYKILNTFEPVQT